MLALSGCASRNAKPDVSLPAPASNDVESESPDLNQRVRMVLMLPADVPPPVALKRRLLRGLNIQILVEVPSARRMDGNLLDPGSVAIEWAGKPLPHHVFYKRPDMALVFALFDPALLEEIPQGELTATAGLVGEEEMAAGWRLPLSFTPEEVSTAREAHEARGPGGSGWRVRMLDPGGQPVGGAWMFGQRREDLLAMSGDNGVVLLDAENRNAPGPHYAWSPRHWTTEFDPIREPRVTVIPRTAATSRDVDLEVRRADGVPPSRSVVLIDNNHYGVYTDVAETVTVRRESATSLLVLSPGHEVGTAVVAPGEDSVAVLLEPLGTMEISPPRPPAPPVETP